MTFAIISFAFGLCKKKRQKILEGSAAMKPTVLLFHLEPRKVNAIHILARKLGVRIVAVPPDRQGCRIGDLFAGTGEDCPPEVPFSEEMLVMDLPGKLLDFFLQGPPAAACIGGFEGRPHCHQQRLAGRQALPGAVPGTGGFSAGHHRPARVVKSLHKKEAFPPVGKRFLFFLIYWIVR